MLSLIIDTAGVIARHATFHQEPMRQAARANKANDRDKKKVAQLKQRIAARDTSSDVMVAYNRRDEARIAKVLARYERRNGFAMKQ